MFNLDMVNTAPILDPTRSRPLTLAPRTVPAYCICLIKHRRSSYRPSMVIFYGEEWSILQTAWLNCPKVEQATVSRGRLVQ